MEYGLVVVWLVAYAVLSVIALPIAGRLFPRFAGLGAGLAPTIALSVLTLGGYVAGHVSMGLALPVGLGSLVVLGAVAALDWAALSDGDDWLARFVRPAEPGDRRVRLTTELIADRRPLVDSALVFTGGFLLVVAIRAVDPAVGPLGGEKFLDFGLLQTLDRATALPPQDMWFAGESVMYYYGGHLTATVLSQLTATPPRFAYNLALAGFYAALVTAAYELAGAVGANRDVPRRVAGLFAVFFVGLASNLLTAGRVVLGLLPGGIRQSVAERVAARSGQYTAEDLLAGVDQFSYWTASRIIEGTINEFPLFAWLNGDLHAHMMGTPFLLLGAALAYSYYRTPADERRRRRLLAFGAVPVLAGLIAVVDTWSFPSVFGLLVLALALAPADPLSLFPPRVSGLVRDRLALSTDDLRGGGPVSLRAEAVRAGAAVSAGILSGALGALLAAPFLLTATGGGDRAIELLPAAARSGLGGLALVHGAFVVAFGTYLWRRLRPERPWLLVGSLVALGWVALSVQAPVLLLTVPLGVGAVIALRLDRPVGFEAVLILAGAGLVTIVELLYVVEQAGPLRLNTVFKVYMQTWVLWGVAAGVAVPALVSSRAQSASVLSGDSQSSEVSTDSTVTWPDGTGLRGTLSVLLVIGLVLSTSVYGGLALSAHFESGSSATLDATAFVERDHPEDAPAIDYVDSLPGQPTLVSAPATSRCLDLDASYPCPPGMYDWDSSPAASLTGVPTVAGWAHEIGYRGKAPYLNRARDVDAIYTGDAETRTRLLAAYDVEYIWVGAAERDRYGDVSFADTPGVEPVFREGRVTIYRVDQQRLGDRN